MDWTITIYPKKGEKNSHLAFPMKEIDAKEGKCSTYVNERCDFRLDDFIPWRKLDAIVNSDGMIV